MMWKQNPFHSKIADQQQPFHQQIIPKKMNDLSNLKEGQITTYSPVIWPKFKLSTYGLKFDILPN